MDFVRQVNVYTAGYFLPASSKHWTSTHLLTFFIACCFRPHPSDSPLSLNTTPSDSIRLAIYYHHVWKYYSTLTLFCPGQRHTMSVSSLTTKAFLTPYGLRPRACVVCKKKDDLLCCAGCQVIYYCSRDHQVADRPAHKTSCGEVRRARTKCEEEERLLREKPSHIDGDQGPEGANFFASAAGRFCEFDETVAYRCSKTRLVDALANEFTHTNKNQDRYGYVDAVNLTLRHVIEQLRLSSGTIWSARFRAPNLYLSLGRDQEAYDFVRWWAVEGTSWESNPSYPSTPFLTPRDEDVLEPLPETWVEMEGEQFHLALAGLLIKVRVLLDLQTIQSARRAFAGVLPKWAVDLICRKQVGAMVASREDILQDNISDISVLIATIKGQIRQMYRSTGKYNPSFWDAFFQVAGYKAKYKIGTADSGVEFHAFRAIIWSRTAWHRTPGAVDVMWRLQMSTLANTYPSPSTVSSGELSAGELSSEELSSWDLSAGEPSSEER